MKPLLRALGAAALLFGRGTAAQATLNSDPRFLKRTDDSLDPNQKKMLSDSAFEMSKDHNFLPIQTDPKLVEIGLSGKGVISQESVVLNFPNGAGYVGDVVNGEKHGRGVLTWANGDSYDGEFENGKNHGRGVFISSSGGWKYEGEFENGKEHGSGVLTLAVGAKYDGEFKNGNIHGEGVLTWANGDSYDGEFENSKIHGEGVLTWANRDSYDGEFENGKKHGKGVLISSSEGWKYDGEFKDGEKHGKGVLTLTDGESYDGEFKNGKIHGKGVLTSANGDRYEGEFENDKPRGKGVLTWANGFRFEGRFENNEMHIKDVLTLMNENRYEGEFLIGEKYDNPWTYPMVAIGVITPLLVTIYTLKKISPERNPQPNPAENPQPNPADGETFYPQEVMERWVRSFARTTSSGSFDPEYLDTDQKKALLLLAINRAGEIFESLAQISYSESLSVQINADGHVTAADLSLIIRSGEDVIERTNRPLEISADQGNVNKAPNQFWESSESQALTRLLPTVDRLLTDITDCPEKEELRQILMSFLVENHKYEKIKTIRLQDGQTVEKNFIYDCIRERNTNPNPRLNRERLQEAVKIFREEVTNYRKEVHGELYEAEILEKLKKDIEEVSAGSSDRAAQTSLPSFVFDSTPRTFSITTSEVNKVATETKAPERES